MIIQLVTRYEISFILAITYARPRFTVNRYIHNTVRPQVLIVFIKLNVLDFKERNYYVKKNALRGVFLLDKTILALTTAMQQEENFGAAGV